MTSKQRAYLRGMANELTAIFQIGKNGINENLVNQVIDALEVRELVKISVLSNSLTSAKEAAEEMAESTGAHSIQVIGSKFVLYKESKENKKIILPKK